MKLNWRHAVKLFTIIVMLIFTQSIVQAQVFTRILDKSETIDNYLPWHFKENPSPKIVPPVDVEAVLERDKKEGRTISRYGVASNLRLTEKDGDYYKFGNYTVWKMLITSEGAKSLNFEFSNLNLPEESKMFIYGMDERMIHGPVIAKNVHGRNYTSDLVYGDYVIVEVFLTEDVVDEFSISIDNAIHGINLRLEKAFGDSQGCNINVECDEGEGWENEINAVCLILTNEGAELCTGTLINNECSDLTPYLLTANHCLNGWNVGNPDTWNYRFNYESETCPEASEPPSNIWITFFGAETRASWGGTDFALLELQDDITINTPPDLSFAGWNRDSNPPTNIVTAIHHPWGDVKKISFNNDGIDDEGNFWDIVQWDVGLVEPGSSGCGLFDENQLIIGQLHGGDGNIGCAGAGGLVDSTDFGKFDVYWDGNGTNDSRLSNWLSETQNPPLTTDALPVPFISGDDIVCTSSENYVLQNPIPNRIITWSVSPASLFGSLTSGNGVTAILWAASTWAKGSAILTYTLDSPNCGTQTITKELWIGKPEISGIRTPKCFIKRTNVTLWASVQGQSSLTWTFPDCPNGKPVGDPDPECWFNYDEGSNSSQIFVYVGEQEGSISVWATNKCGTSSINVPINYCEDIPPGPGPIIKSGFLTNPEIVDAGGLTGIVVFPNPADEILTVVLDKKIFSEEELKTIQLLDIHGKEVFQKSIFNNRLQIDVQKIPSGVFYLKTRYKATFSIQKVIIF